MARQTPLITCLFIDEPLSECSQYVQFLGHYSACDPPFLFLSSQHALESVTPKTTMDAGHSVLHLYGVLFEISSKNSPTTILRSDEASKARGIYDFISSKFSIKICTNHVPALEVGNPDIKRFAPPQYIVNFGPVATRQTVLCIVF